MQHARGTLSKIYANAAQHFAGEQAPLVAWPLVCGAKIAQRTAALSCINGELAVRVPDKLWRTQLDCLSNQYLAAINQVSRHKVKRIRFVAGD
jgi:predicted nucleic acid-binding Zn ribbon protein